MLNNWMVHTDFAAGTPTLSPWQHSCSFGQQHQFRYDLLFPPRTCKGMMNQWCRRFCPTPVTKCVLLWTALRKNLYTLQSTLVEILVTQGSGNLHQTRQLKRNGIGKDTFWMHNRSLFTCYLQPTLPGQNAASKCAVFNGTCTVCVCVCEFEREIEREYGDFSVCLNYFRPTLKPFCLRVYPRLRPSAFSRTNWHLWGTETLTATAVDYFLTWSVTFSAHSQALVWN